MTRRTRTFCAALLAASVAGLVACGGGESGESGAMEDEGQAAGQAGGEAAEMQEADTARAGEAGEAVDVTLAPRNESGVEGRARLHHHGDTLHVTVRLTGLESGNDYPVHIHQGTCAEGGGVAAGLTSVSAGEGTGNSESSVPADELSMDASYFVQAHLPDGTPAACGDVPGHEGSSDTGSGGSSG